MAKVLGLDLGTNSLGWALVDESENEYTLIDKGVDIFQEGVARDKNNENVLEQHPVSRGVEVERESPEERFLQGGPLP
uniref:hypothetical protein n=1 Tax=Alistipes shahii TaxID=328814 RepID=UPI003FEE9F37